MADYLDELVQRISTKANLKGFDDLNKAQRRAIKQNDLLGKSLRNAFGFFLGIQGVRSIVDSYTKLDDLRRVLNGLAGSAEEGGKQFEYLKREAFRTATDLTTIAGAYKNFYSAAKGAGFKTGQIQGMFSGVLTAGRGLGANQQQIGGALLALEQMLSKGKVSMEELRKQLGNALPGAMQIAARAMGVTNEKFQEMVKGGIDSSKFVALFAKQAEKELGKNLKENVKSLSSEFTNLKNAWDLVVYDAMREGGTGDSLAQAVRELTELLRSAALKTTLAYVGKALSFIIRHLKWILMFWGFKKIVDITMAIRRLHLELIGMAASTAALGTATRTMVAGYALLTSGQVLNGIRMLAVGMWATVAPIAAVSATVAGLVSWFMILQDLWMYFTDPNAITVTGLYASTKEMAKKIKGTKGLAPVTTEQKDIVVKSLRAQGKQATFKPNEEGTWDLVDIKDTMIKGTIISNPTPRKQSLDGFGNATGYAAPLIPNVGYSGSLPDINGSFGDKRTSNVTNNWTVNVYAPDGQAQTIVQSFEDALGGFLDKYQMGYA